jgi:hypothetical protein
VLHDVSILYIVVLLKRPALRWDFPRFDVETALLLQNGKKEAPPNPARPLRGFPYFPKNI